MRLRLPRGVSGRQIARHLLPLLVAGGVWLAGGANSFRRLHESTDARFAANRLRHRILEARLSAQTFLSRDVQDPRFFLGLPLPAMEELTHALSEAGDRIDTLDRLRPQGRPSTERLRGAVERYQGAFMKVTELHRRQGHAEWGLEGDWQKALRELEAAVGDRADLALLLLHLRASEKDYLLRRDPQLLEAARQRQAALREAARPLGRAAAARLEQALDKYRAAFDEYAAIDAQIGLGADGGLRAEMARAAQEMEPLVRAIHDDAARDAAAMRRRVLRVNLLALTVGVLVGGGVSYLLARFLPPAAPPAEPLPAGDTRSAAPVELQQEPFALEEIVAGAVRPLAARAHAKGVELAFRIDPSAPETVIGDAARTQQVLVSLVDNAVKFTDRGEILVSVDAFELPEGHRLFRTLVADTGLGVPADRRAAVFEPGLSLGVSSQLAALMGGGIEVDEAPGGGSVFTFTARMRAAAASTPGTPNGLDGRAMLVIDDSATCRKIVLERLASWGIRGTGVSSCDGAVAAIARARDAGHVFAAAIVDVDLPGAIELAPRLARERLHWPVIVMLPPDGSGTERQHAAGVTWSVTKPIEPSRLRQVLQHALTASASRSIAQS